MEGYLASFARSRKLGQTLTQESRGEPATGGKMAEIPGAGAVEMAPASFGIQNE